MILCSVAKFRISMFQNLFMCLHLFYKFSEDQLFKYILRKKKDLCGYIRWSTLVDQCCHLPVWGLVNYISNIVQQTYVCWLFSCCMTHILLRRTRGVNRFYSIILGPSEIWNSLFPLVLYQINATHLCLDLIGYQQYSFPWNAELSIESFFALDLMTVICWNVICE